MKQNVLPTNTCFDDAMDFIMVLIRENKAEDIYLCHGLVTPDPKKNIGNKKTYSHGWIYDEQTNSCMQWGILDGKKVGIRGDKGKFYADMGVHKITYYTPKQAMYYSWLYDFFGPWEPEYMKLCGDSSVKKRVYDPDFPIARFKKHLDEHH